LPILTFDHDVTIHLNGEDIHVIHLQTGHTDSDSVVFFPKSNVVHMGDDGRLLLEEFVRPGVVKMIVRVNDEADRLVGDGL